MELDSKYKDKRGNIICEGDMVLYDGSQIDEGIYSIEWHDDMLWVMGWDVPLGMSRLILDDSVVVGRWK